MIRKGYVIPSLFRNLEFGNDNKLNAFVLVPCLVLPDLNSVTYVTYLRSATSDAFPRRMALGEMNLSLGQKVGLTLSNIARIGGMCYRVISNGGDKGNNSKDNNRGRDTDNSRDTGTRNRRGAGDDILYGPPDLEKT